MKMLMVLVLSCCFGTEKPAHPSLSNMFGESTVKLTAGGAKYSGPATITFYGDGWLVVDLAPTTDANGEEVDNSFAVQVSRKMVVTEDDKKVTLAQEAGTKVNFLFNGDAANQWSIAGPAQLAYNATTGQTSLTVNGQGTDSSFGAEFTLDVCQLPNTLSADCPGGSCQCSSNGPNACCSSGFHPVCSNCGTNQASAKCVKNVGCIEPA